MALLPLPWIAKIKRNLSQRKNYFKTIAIMLINIPIVIVYLCIAIPMVDYIRNTIELTLVNNTEKPILEISAANCDTKTIEKLDVQESKTLYINIKGQNNSFDEDSPDDYLSLQRFYLFPFSKGGFQLFVFMIDLTSL